MKRLVTAGAAIAGAVVAALGIAALLERDLRAGPRAAIRLAAAAQRAVKRGDTDRTRAARIAAWRVEPEQPEATALVGDSLAARFPPELLPRDSAPWLLRGLGGEAVDGLRGRIGEVLARRPTAVVVQTGTNDVLRGASPGEVAQRMRRLLTDVREALPDTHLVVLSLPPASAWRADPDVVRAVNRRLEALTRAARGTFVDTFGALAADDGQPADGLSTDGVHLTHAGYEREVPLLRGALRADAD